VVLTGAVSHDRPQGAALEALQRIARRHHLDEAFPDVVIEEAKRWVDHPDIDDPALEDRTHLPFVTIDGPGTRDLDQALYIEPEGAGTRIHYALADASHFVRPGTALFAEALQRGSSFYLPGWSIPMLPRVLSEGVISLNEGVERRALVLTMVLDAEAKLLETQISRCRMKSYAKLTFGEVQAFLDGRPSPRIQGSLLQQSLRLLQRVGQDRMKLADQRDHVRYRRVELNIRFDGSEGQRFVAIAAPRYAVERYNEQVSLLCNIEGARFLRAHAADPGTHAIYRVHPGPSPDRYERFSAMLQQLATTHDLDPARWTWVRQSRTSLADFLEALPTTGPRAGLSQAIHRQAIVMNYRSTFSQTPAPHAGVGTDIYARFSAPMREMVGIFLHKETVERIDEQPSHPDDDDLRAQIIVTANRAREVQRRITKEANLLVLDQLFEGDLAQRQEQRPVRTGTVTGLDHGRIYVLLQDPPIDVKAYVPDLAEVLGESLAIDEHGVEVHDAQGRTICRLGDTVELRVEQRRKKNRWVFSLRAPVLAVEH
jgi:ribonuclease R